MVKLDRGEVEHIANLAKLALSEEELRAYQAQLSAILGHFEQLQALDTEDIPPTATVLPLESVMRRDEVEQPLEHEKVLENAPQTKDGCFKVPSVLE